MRRDPKQIVKARRSRLKTSPVTVGMGVEARTVILKPSHHRGTGGAEHNQ
jgi:hypothetical protein